ncbi:hypothetical protein H0W80_03490 [Candidatus Saccharibacteria bacterium]|nr:hypothetical protein [Candidatus Saccharibacteria bacterium]
MFVDFYGLLWAFGKKTKSQMIDVSGVAQKLIWAGLAGLILTGIVLRPDITNPLVRIKMLFVLIIIYNGLNLHYVRKAMMQQKVQKFSGLSKKLAIWSLLSITLSQVAWLGAMILGLIIGV